MDFPVFDSISRFDSTTGRGVVHAMVFGLSREELKCWVTLQLAISGSGVLPLPFAFASCGAPLGVLCCGAVALLNDATTQWLLAAAKPVSRGGGVARSYTDLVKRAKFSRAAEVAVELSTALLLFGSLAACLAAVGENAERAAATYGFGSDFGDADARLLAPVLAGAVIAAAGLRSYDDMAVSSALGVLFLASLLLAIVAAAVITAGDGRSAPLRPLTWTAVPPAVSTLGYSLYIGPVALAMLDDRHGRVDVVRRATHVCFLTTFVIYCALGLAGASWLGRDAPGDVSTAFRLEEAGGAWAAPFVPAGTVLYLTLANVPLFAPLRDSLGALTGLDGRGVVAATCASLALAVVVAVGLKSLVLFSLSGATGVCVTCYVVPVAAHWSIARERDRKYDGGLVARTICNEVLAPALALAFGVAVSVLAIALDAAAFLQANMPARPAAAP